MKNFLKSSLSIFLAITIIFSSAILGLSVVDFNEFFAIKAEAASSGYCGEDLTWTLDDEGILTISGTGAMDDYSYHSSLVAPWFSLKSSVKNVVINNGVTSVGNQAFVLCDNVTSVIIPDSVLSIGMGAFINCISLTAIEISDNVISIGSEAFEGTGYANDESNWENGALYVGNHLIIAPRDISGSYKIRNGTKSIASCAFFEHENFQSITIPDSVVSIGDFAFYYCTKLKYVEIPRSVEFIGIGAFAGIVSSSSDFALWGAKDSVAEEYAKSNGFKFVNKYLEKPKLSKVFNASSGVRITWKNVEGADLYRVYRMASGGEYEYIGSTTNKYFNDKKAPAGKTCRYKIRAKNEAGYSAYSASLAIKHIDEPTLKSIENSAYGVLIKWDKVTGAQKYNVYRKVSGGEYKYIGATSNAYYTDKTAKSGTKYYYAIRAKRDDSVSSQSSSLSKYYLEDTTLNTPTSTSKGIGLRWSEVAGAEGYKVYRRTTNGSYKIISTEKGVSNLTYRDTTAKKGTKYYYKVKAYKSKTYSAYSNTKAITDKY